MELFDGCKQIEDTRHVFCCCTVDGKLVIVGIINLVNEACFASTCYFMLMRGRWGWQQDTKKYNEGYRSRVLGNGIVITIICVTIDFLLCFIFYPACTLWHPWGVWLTTALRRIVRPLFLALTIFDMGLAIEVLQFYTLLVVVVVHSAVLAATGKLSCKMRWCLEVLVSNKFMLEDVTLHMLLPVLYFRVRLLLHEVERTIWGAFLSATALEIRLLILFNLERFSSVLFFSPFFLSSASFTPLLRRYDSALSTSWLREKFSLQPSGIMPVSLTIFLMDWRSEPSPLRHLRVRDLDLTS